MIRFKEYLAEETDNRGSLTIFDIDDTLFHTTAQIAVVKNGNVIKKLTNNEFNTYKLEAGETFDFSEFRDAHKFYTESKPIARMLEKAKIILKNAQKNPLSKVVIVTARANFDDKEKFLATFRKHGFDIDKVRVERAGNISGEFIPAFKKAIIIRNYLRVGTFSKVRLFDDAMSNLKEFLKLKTEFPDVKFEAYFAYPDGKIKTIR
jgi:FMN phosphatase YigB (HAD superfamily)